MKSIVKVWIGWFLGLFSKHETQKACVLACRLEENEKEAKKYSNQKELSRRWR